MKLKVVLPSTTIKLEIALTKVSTVLMVNDRPKVTITIDKSLVCSVNNKEKKPKSGIALESTETATKPLKPIKKTIGMITIKETIKLFLRSIDALKNNAEIILNKLSKKTVKKFNIYYDNSFVEAGSGSLPTEKIPSIVLLLSSKKISSNKIQKAFLNLEKPLIGYIKNNIFHIDLKAITDDQINLLVNSIEKISI